MAYRFGGKMFWLVIEDDSRVMGREVVASNAQIGAAIAHEMAQGRSYSLWAKDKRISSVETDSYVTGLKVPERGDSGADGIKTGQSW